MYDSIFITALLRLSAQCEPEFRLVKNVTDSTFI
jgi:hypothetical protein